ncbi:unnamed protein product [Symbiodinium necroappetens]|uniref:Uncharacterized protein n=1 Tax=Symbiodinium necroappetens TaxID=1628268 RepID=A0A812RY83_9DINO|nr:unnamed protein product [Symbiodinium necroappetens]
MESAFGLDFGEYDEEALQTILISRAAKSSVKHLEEVRQGLAIGTSKTMTKQQHQAIDTEANQDIWDFPKIRGVTNAVLNLLKNTLKVDESDEEDRRLFGDLEMNDEGMSDEPLGCKGDMSLDRQALELNARPGAEVMEFFHDRNVAEAKVQPDANQLTEWDEVLDDSEIEALNRLVYELQPKLAPPEEMSVQVRRKPLLKYNAVLFFGEASGANLQARGGGGRDGAVQDIRRAMLRSLARPSLQKAPEWLLSLTRLCRVVGQSTRPWRMTSALYTGHYWHGVPCPCAELCRWSVRCNTMLSNLEWLT